MFDIKSLFKRNKGKDKKAMVKVKPFKLNTPPPNFEDMMSSMLGIPNHKPLAPQGRKVNIKIGFTKSKNYYPISVVCSNCLFNDTASVKKGIQVGQVPCPKCGCHYTLRSFLINTREKDNQPQLT